MAKRKTAPPAAKPPAQNRAAKIHVALMRGINVGGKNLLPMASLSEMFISAGCTDVRTYIQSGNVVFAASPAVVKRIAKDVARRIEVQFKLSVPVVIRSAGEMERTVVENPFVRSASDDTSAIYVMFLADEPDPARVASLDPNRSPGDAFQVCGREIYLNLGTGAAKTKLTNAYFDSKLGTITTARNWNTVLKLVEMARG